VICFYDGEHSLVGRLTLRLRGFCMKILKFVYPFHPFSRTVQCSRAMPTRKSVNALCHEGKGPRAPQGNLLLWSNLL
jgi:hypothetical protein